MRILVVSDSHGKNNDIKELLKQVGEIDMFIHLGDIESDAERVRVMVNCETHMIRGNNDFTVELPSHESFMIEDKRVYITHGHRFYVGYGVDKLREFAYENEYDIVMFGHTHVPFLEIGDEVTILNPGSISYPRQEGRDQTFMLIEVDDKGELHYSKGVLNFSKKDQFRKFFWE